MRSRGASLALGVLFSVLYALCPRVSFSDDLPVHLESSPELREFKRLWEETVGKSIFELHRHRLKLPEREIVQEIAQKYVRELDELYYRDYGSTDRDAFFRDARQKGHRKSVYLEDGTKVLLKAAQIGKNGDAQLIVKLSLRGLDGVFLIRNIPSRINQERQLDGDHPQLIKYARRLAHETNKVIVDMNYDAKSVELVPEGLMIAPSIYNPMRLSGWMRNAAQGPRWSTVKHPLFATSILTQAGILAGSFAVANLLSEDPTTWQIIAAAVAIRSAYNVFYASFRDFFDRLVKVPIKEDGLHEKQSYSLALVTEMFRRAVFALPAHLAVVVTVEVFMKENPAVQDWHYWGYLLTVSFFFSTVEKFSSTVMGILVRSLEERRIVEGNFRVLHVAKSIRWNAWADLPPPNGVFSRVANTIPIWRARGRWIRLRHLAPHHFFRSFDWTAFSNPDPNAEVAEGEKGMHKIFFLHESLAVFRNIFMSVGATVDMITGVPVALPSLGVVSLYFLQRGINGVERWENERLEEQAWEEILSAQNQREFLENISILSRRSQIKATLDRIQRYLDLQQEHLAKNASKETQEFLDFQVRHQKKRLEWLENRRLVVPGLNGLVKDFKFGCRLMISKLKQNPKSL